MGKNQLGEMEYPSQSKEESEMQFLGAISEMREWSLYVSKANHSVSQ